MSDYKSKIVIEWQDAHGFLSFHHKDHPRYGDDFADTVHNTCLWLMQEVLNEHMQIFEVRERLEKFLALTRTANGYVRYPGSWETLNRDQLTPLIPLMRWCGMDKEADKIIELHATDISPHWKPYFHDKHFLLGKAYDLFEKLFGNFLMPHWRDHFYQESSILGYVFECLDSVSDWFSNSESSQVKNICRLIWASARGEKNRLACFLFRLKIDAYRVMEIYGSRTPYTPRDMYDTLPHEEPGVLTPPPIYLGFDKLVKKYM